MVMGLSDLHNIICFIIPINRSSKEYPKTEETKYVSMWDKRIYESIFLFSVLLPKIIHVLGPKLTIFTLIMILASQVYFNA